VVVLKWPGAEGMALFYRSIEMRNACRHQTQSQILRVKMTRTSQPKEMEEDFLPYLVVNEDKAIKAKAIKAERCPIPR